MRAGRTGVQERNFQPRGPQAQRSKAVRFLLCLCAFGTIDLPFHPTLAIRAISRSLSSRRRIFIMELLGSSATNTISLGTL